MKVYGNPCKVYDPRNYILTNSEHLPTFFIQWSLEVRRSTLSSNRPGENSSSASCYLGDLGKLLQRPVPPYLTSEMAITTARTSWTIRSE